MATSVDAVRLLFYIHRVAIADRELVVDIFAESKYAAVL